LNAFVTKSARDDCNVAFTPHWMLCRLSLEIIQYIGYRFGEIPVVNESYRAPVKLIHSVR